MSTPSITSNSMQGLSATDIASMDIETALMAVQSDRARLLEGQLQSQLQDVQARNGQISKLNEAMSAGRTLSAKFKDDAKSTDGIDKNSAEYQAFAQAASNAGVDISGVGNKGQLTAQIENLKSMVDGQSNSQQMEMLRLQSLSNKRNEAFDLMTNYTKKMQDSRSSIIGNMR